MDFTEPEGATTINLAALVAQLDRASDYGSEGWGFESLRARHIRAVQSVKLHSTRMGSCLWGAFRGATRLACVFSPHEMTSFAQIAPNDETNKRRNTDSEKDPCTGVGAAVRRGR